MKHIKFHILSILFVGLLSHHRLVAEEITAVVKSADTASRTLTLEDGKKVKVSLGDAQIGYVGQRIRGELVKDGDVARLDFIWPANKVDEQVAAGINNLLQRDTVDRGRKVFRSVGEYLPPFALYNQDGKLVTNKSLNGRTLVMNFIFTRCLVATMCPAATARMARLQREIDEAGLTGIELISVSFDPEYDTPGILRLYGEQRGIDFKNFMFLTGKQQTINDLLKQMGILVIEEDDTLNHTIATLLISDMGKILYRKDGSRWSTRDFLDRLKELDKRKHAQQ